MEFYAGGEGDLKIRAWNAKTLKEEIAWLAQEDANLVIRFIMQQKMPTKEAVILARGLIVNG